MTVVPDDAEAVHSILEDLGLGFTEERGVITIPLASTRDAVPVVERLGKHIVSFEVRTGTLDDAFVSITGGEE